MLFLCVWLSAYYVTVYTDVLNLFKKCTVVLWMSFYYIVGFLLKFIHLINARYIEHMKLVYAEFTFMPCS